MSFLLKLDRESQKQSQCPITIHAYNSKIMRLKFSEHIQLLKSVAKITIFSLLQAS